jgi:hypothetical protein
MSGQIESSDPAVVADTVGTQVAALFGFEVKKELVRKGWKLVKEAAKDGDGIALKADELLGQDFNPRLGLGLVLAAFEEKTKTTIDDFATIAELALCLDVTLPDVLKSQAQAATDGGRGTHAV